MKCIWTNIMTKIFFLHRLNCLLFHRVKACSCMKLWRSTGFSSKLFQPASQAFTWLAIDVGQPHWDQRTRFLGGIHILRKHIYWAFLTMFIDIFSVVQFAGAVSWIFRKIQQILRSRKSMMKVFRHLKNSQNLISFNALRPLSDQCQKFERVF